ncbi:substrate-binding periplasmic protein [Vibrio zhugei]|uniref:Substrate-binding periplasmic protein n=2 Tax=Vibrio zhugei TaxID=2479546 RepID=A0ABV7C690_9VIBR|nr:transporter substrate-binding domain-containing protein [Vibrio zhugei]
MMPIARYLLLLVCYAVTIPFTHAAEKRIIVAVQDEWPPYVIDSQPASGLSVDIARAAFKTQNYALTVEIKPWSRALKEAQYGRDIVLIAAWHSKERDKFLYFSKPYLYNEISLISLKDNNFDWRTFADLDGKTVGTIQNYAYDDEFMANPWTNKVLGKTLEYNIRQVLNGRIDMFIEEYRVAKWTMQKHGIDVNRFRKVHPNVAYSGLYLAAGKSNPNAKEYVAAFNRGLKKIRISGELDRIIRHYEQ